VNLSFVVQLKPFTIQAIENCKVPSENVNVQALVLLAEVIQKREKLYGVGSGVGIATAEQRDIAVELPTRNENIVFGISGRVIKRSVIISAINEQARLGDFADCPAVLLRL
jgi:hypothetical protein